MDFGYYTNMETLYTGRVHGFSDSGAGVGAGAGAESVASLCAVLGSSVSLVALVFAFLTYSLFSDLRSLAGTAMINLLASLFMVQLLYVIGVGGVQEPELCVGLAFALHYMRLAVLGWLVAAAHHTHAAFTESVSSRKLRLSGRYACYSVLCWCGPLLALVGVALLRRGPGGMLDTSRLVGLNCWFVEAEAYGAFFLAPAVLCLLTACVLLLLAARASRRLALLEQERSQLRRRQLLLRLFSRVTALLALVVGAGAAARFGGASATPWVVFNVAHGLQGVAVASCVTCNCRVLRLYSRSLRRSGRRRSLTSSVSAQTLVSGPPPALV